MVPYSHSTHGQNDYTQLPAIPHTHILLYPRIHPAATERDGATQCGFYSD